MICMMLDELYSQFYGSKVCFSWKPWFPFCIYICIPFTLHIVGKGITDNDAIPKYFVKAYKLTCFHSFVKHNMI